MLFSERMKALLSQGAAASKDFAAKAGEKAQDWGGKGLKASKELLGKAGAKAQELGSRGVLMLEIRQLEGQAERLVARLGAEAYRVFAEEGSGALDAAAPAVKALLAEIAAVREKIEAREKELKALGK